MKLYTLLYDFVRIILTTKEYSTTDGRKEKRKLLMDVIFLPDFFVECCAGWDLDDDALSQCRRDRLWAQRIKSRKVYALAEREELWFDSNNPSSALLNVRIPAKGKRTGRKHSGCRSLAGRSIDDGCVMLNDGWFGSLYRINRDVTFTLTSSAKSMQAGKGKKKQLWK